MLRNLSILGCLVLWSTLAGAARAESAAPTWHVFLVAADRAEPVFDNAVDRLRAALKTRYGIVASAFSARARPPRDKHASTWDEIARVVASRRMGPEDACLFYFTSHGDEGGLYMARHRALLPPSMLARLLDSTCGTRPTVVVVSACHSGTFLAPPLTTDRRIILTAARRDRSSFGCSFREQLTVYDRCFLDAWPVARTWTELHTSVASCVGAAETARRYRPPSEPQAHFGRLMRDFPVHPPAPRE